jgi:hypothetical protein
VGFWIEKRPALTTSAVRLESATVESNAANSSAGFLPERSTKWLKGFCSQQRLRQLSRRAPYLYVNWGPPLTQWSRAEAPVPALTFVNIHAFVLAWETDVPQELASPKALRPLARDDAKKIIQRKAEAVHDEESFVRRNVPGCAVSRDHISPPIEYNSRPGCRLRQPLQ